MLFANIGRAHRRLAVTVLLGVIAALAPVAAAPAYALQSCPSNPTAYIQSWVSAYQARGVTSCMGLDYSGTPAVFVQIADFSAGAKMRVVSQVASGSTPGTPDTTFNKRSASDWYTWTQGNVSTPPGSRLFSTTNASFFVTTSGSTSALSLPEKMSSSIRSQGYALTHHGDAAWSATKRKLGLGNPSSTPQSIAGGSFPTSYTASDVTNQLSSYYDAVVALDPLYGSVFARKTMLGINGSRAYLMATLSLYWNDQARSILVDNFATTWEIQLDGGNSTQMYSAYGSVSSSSNRIVPDVLAIYLAP